MPRWFDLAAADLARLLRAQQGVIARRQLLGLGAAPTDVRRLLRRRELHHAWPGVYVDHNGPLTDLQRAWVAVSAAWPAALTAESVLPEASRELLHVAVSHGRQLQLPPWVAAHRTTDWEQRVDPRIRPPSIRLEHALIDVMADRAAYDVASAFDVLARTMHSRRTSADRVLAVLDARKRVPHRATIRGLVGDHRDGVCSVLEQGYRHRVERAHALPRGQRQRRSHATGRMTATDVEYDAYGVIVELDGRAYHESPRARDDDARRDIAELATREAVTARVTHGLVFADACRTAAWIGSILAARGWPGPLGPCPQCGT